MTKKEYPFGDNMDNIEKNLIYSVFFWPLIHLFVVLLPSKTPRFYPSCKSRLQLARSDERVNHLNVNQVIKGLRITM